MPLDGITRPFRPTPNRGIDCGRRLHAVPDNIVTADLSRQLTAHVSPGWYAVVMFSDGRGVGMPETAEGVAPPDYVISTLTEWVVALNAELHSDGHWVVGWSDAQEPVLIWRDGDGDIHLATEISRKMEMIESYGTENILSQAAKALTEARTTLALLELGRGQTIKLAQKRASRRA